MARRGRPRKLGPREVNGQLQGGGGRFMDQIPGFKRVRLEVVKFVAVKKSGHVFIAIGYHYTLGNVVSVTVVLGELQKEGMIQIARRRVKILNLQNLGRQVDQNPSHPKMPRQPTTNLHSMSIVS